MRTASRHEDVPELTNLQKRALQAFEDLADSIELRMDYVLQPGDIQLLHNHSIVHARTAFVDHDDVSGHSCRYACVHDSCIEFCRLHWSAISALRPEHLDRHGLISLSSRSMISFETLQVWLVQCALKALAHCKLPCHMF